MDSANTANYPACFDVIILDTVLQTMPYAVSVHTNLDSLWLKLSYSL